MCRLGATMFSECREEAGGHGESARLSHLLHIRVICACVTVVCLSYIYSELLTSNNLFNLGHFAQLKSNIFSNVLIKAMEIVFVLFAPVFGCPSLRFLLLP